MKERKKTEQKQQDSGSGAFEAGPGLPVNPNVSVASGPYAEELPVAGSTVGEVRKRFSDRFDIDPKSTAVVNGKPADETYVLKSGEHLLFVRHAGEKGSATVWLEGSRALTQNNTAPGERSMSISRLCDEITARTGLRTGVIPHGTRAMFRRGPLTILVWEQPPRVHRLRWIAPGSPEPYGSGAKYEWVTIALPYVIIYVVMVRMDSTLCTTQSNECFFRNETLKSADDKLSFPGLLNCSKHNTQEGHPLSWICTQNMGLAIGMSECVNAVRSCLLDTAFNLSSEHHEGNSWYSASKHIDERISTTKQWEKATKADPLFVLQVPWLDTGHTVQSMADRIFDINGCTNKLGKDTDIKRIIYNCHE